MTSLREHKLHQSSEGEISKPAKRKPYTKPKIILELELETRAGSPLGMPDPFDPFDPLGLGLPKQ